MLRPASIEHSSNYYTRRRPSVAAFRFFAALLLLLATYGWWGWWQAGCCTKDGKVISATDRSYYNEAGSVRAEVEHVTTYCIFTVLCSSIAKALGNRATDWSTNIRHIEGVTYRLATLACTFRNKLVDDIFAPAAFRHVFRHWLRFWRERTNVQSIVADCVLAMQLGNMVAKASSQRRTSGSTYEGNANGCAGSCATNTCTTSQHSVDDSSAPSARLGGVMAQQARQAFVAKDVPLHWAINDSFWNQIFYEIVLDGLPRSQR